MVAGMFAITLAFVVAYLLFMVFTVVMVREDRSARRGHVHDRRVSDRAIGAADAEVSSGRAAFGGDET
jgi:hypothetical protein